MAVDELIQRANRFCGYAVVSGGLSAFSLIESQVTDQSDHSMPLIGAGLGLAVVAATCVYRSCCLENKFKRKNNSRRFR